MAYNAKDNAFGGTVKNVTDQSLEAVRVEVHLSSGTELGPTMPTDLEPGQERSVMLEAGNTNFSGRTPHAEAGRDEHGAEGGHNQALGAVIATGLLLPSPVAAGRHLLDIAKELPMQASWRLCCSAQTSHSAGLASPLISDVNAVG